MHKGEVRKAILDELEKLLGPIGFRITPKTSELIRETSSGRQRIIFSLYDFNPNFYFSLMQSVQFDEMGELFHTAVSHEWTDDRPRPLWRIGISHDYFFNGLPDQFKVSSVEDIKNAVNVLRPGIVGKMIPFFEQCESLGAFENILNESDGLLGATAPYDAFFHIMSSYLANRERLDGVLSKWFPLPDDPSIEDSHRENMTKLVDYIHASRG